MGEYRPNTIVWVKWKRNFWPAKVIRDSSLPEDLQSTVKGCPVACIKFLNEDFYDIIYDEKKLQHYICAEKYNYIRQGIEIKDSEDLEMFKGAVRLAEKEISGNPDIVDSDEMKKKEPKPSEKYKEIFPSASDKKKKRKMENEDDPVTKKSKPEDFDRSAYYEVIYLPQEITDVAPLSNFTSTCPECGYRTAFVENATMHYRTHYDKNFDFRKYINYRQTYSFSGKKRKSKKSVKKVARKKPVSAEEREPATSPKDKVIKSKKKPKLIGKDLKKQLLEDWDEEEEEDEENENVEVVEEEKANETLDTSDAAFDALLADTQVPVIPKAPPPLPVKDTYEFIESDEDRLSTAGDYFSQWCHGGSQSDDEEEEAKLESGPVTPVPDDAIQENHSFTSEDYGSEQVLGVSAPDLHDEESCEVDLQKKGITAAPPEYEDISEVEQFPEMESNEDSDSSNKGDDDVEEMKSSAQPEESNENNECHDEINEIEGTTQAEEETNEVSDSVQKTKEVSDSVQKTKEVSDSVQKTKEVSDSVQKTKEVSDSVQKTKEVSDSVQKTKEVSDSVQKTKEVSDSVQKTKEVSDSVQKTKEVSDSVQKTEEVSDSIQKSTEDVEEIESTTQPEEAPNEEEDSSSKDDDGGEVECEDDDDKEKEVECKDQDVEKETECKEEEPEELMEVDSDSSNKDEDEVEVLEKNDNDELEVMDQDSDSENKGNNEVKEVEVRSVNYIDLEESNQETDSSSKGCKKEGESRCETFVELEESNDGSDFSNKGINEANEMQSKSEVSKEPEPRTLSEPTERTTVSDEEKKSSSKKLLERFLKEQEQKNAEQNKVQSENDDESREVPEVLEITEVQDINENAVCVSSSPECVEDSNDAVIVVKNSMPGAPLENGVVEIEDSSRETDDVMVVAEETEGVITVRDEESNASSEEVTVIFRENEVTQVDGALDLRNRSNHNHEEEALDCSYKGKRKEDSSKRNVPSPDCEYVSDSEEEPDEATIQSFKMASLREDVESAKEEVVTINEEDNNYILIEIDESGSISISQDENEKSSDRLQQRL